MCVFEPCRKLFTERLAIFLLKPLSLIEIFNKTLSLTLIWYSSLFRHSLSAWNFRITGLIETRMCTKICFNISEDATSNLVYLEIELLSLCTQLFSLLSSQFLKSWYFLKLTLCSLDGNIWKFVIFLWLFRNSTY